MVLSEDILKVINVEARAAARLREVNKLNAVRLKDTTGQERMEAGRGKTCEGHRTKSVRSLVTFAGFRIFGGVSTLKTRYRKYRHGRGLPSYSNAAVGLTIGIVGRIRAGPTRG